MDRITNSIYNLRLLDDLAKQDSFIHRLHPVTKLAVTLVFLGAVISFDRYAILPLLPFVFYPLVVFLGADLPVAPIMKRLAMVEPLVIGIGIFNPLFDPLGWFTFASIMIKSALTITACLLLVATTGLDKIAQALRTLKVPSVFVLQLLLTYRYISVLVEELARMLRAYSLKSPGQKGVRLKDAGFFAGQLLLRTYDRATRVYESMRLRGFKGEYHSYGTSVATGTDYLYVIGWVVFIVAARIWNLPNLLGLLLGGVL